MSLPSLLSVLLELKVKKGGRNSNHFLNLLKLWSELGSDIHFSTLPLPTLPAEIVSDLSSTHPPYIKKYYEMLHPEAVLPVGKIHLFSKTFISF